jgi:multidrug efflux system outer membrane protein
MKWSWIGAIALSGCTMYPHYTRPQMEMPTEWRVSSDDTNHYANVEWWKQLNDPVLDGLIDEALKNNQDLKVAIYTVDTFVAQLGITRSQLYPQFNATAEGEREKFSAAPIPLPTTVSPFSNLYNLIFNASYLVDIWGKIRSASDSALASLLAQIETRRTVVLTVVSSVASSYMTLRQFDRQLQISQETLQSRQDSYDLAIIRFELGLTSELEVQQALSEVENAKVQVQDLEISIATQENLISTLLGKPPGEIPRGPLLGELCRNCQPKTRHPLRRTTTDRRQRPDWRRKGAILPPDLPHSRLWL